MGCPKLTYHQETELRIIHRRKELTINKSDLKGGNNLVFGMLMPGRQYNSGEYRFGYQGSLKDNEVAGQGNSYTTFYRQLDPRLARWKSVDPKAAILPWQSPYNAMDGNPILFNDRRGDWIRGAGFFRNVFKSDPRINAENRAREIGGDAIVIRNDDEKKSWNVAYTTGETIISKDGSIVKVQTTNIENFDKKTEKSEFHYARINFAHDLSRFEHRINHAVRSDPFNLNNIPVDEGSRAHNFAKAMAGLNSMVAIPEVVMMYTMDTDIYGDKPSSLDKIVATVTALPFIPKFSEGAEVVLKSKTATEIVESSIDAAGFIYDTEIIQDLTSDKDSLSNDENY